MILFFHFLCLLAQYLVSNISDKILNKKRVRVSSNCNGKDGDVAAGEESVTLLQRNEYLRKPVYEDGTLKFFPPVYVQRYESVALVLEEFASKGKVHKVVDFGCSELGFFMYLKGMDGVTEVLEVDIDEEKLKRFSYKAAPLTTNYLMSRCTKPLDVSVLVGSIAEYDDCLAGTDAVVVIEVIEHLTEEILSRVLYNIFHQIKPRVAIFTTPNSEFNSLFPNLTDLRHSDHKFEWTRKEFYTWTQDILAQYPEYSVRFYGIGAGPEGTENLGCCTQMAVFERVDDTEVFESARERLDGAQKYKLINHYSYPVYEDTRTVEEKIIHEIQYQMAYIITLSSYYNFDENQCEVPLSLLQEYVTDLCNDEDELRKTLLNSGMKIFQKEGAWYLAQSESAGSSHDDSFEDEYSYTGERTISKDTLTLDEKWDLTDEIIQTEDATFFQTARSTGQTKPIGSCVVDQYSCGDDLFAVKEVATVKTDFRNICQVFEHPAILSNRHISEYKGKCTKD